MVDELSRLDALLARARAGPAGGALQRVVDGWRWLAAVTRQAVEAVRRPAAGVLRPAHRAARAVSDPVSEAATRSAAALRPGRPPILYRDRLMTLDEQGVVVTRYFMPVGRRRIDYSSVRSVRELPLTGYRVYRVHGFSFPRYWLHRDSSRGERSVGLVLDTGRWLRPVLTPVDVDAVLAILWERTDARHA